MVANILITLGIALIAVGVLGVALRLVHGRPQDEPAQPLDEQLPD